MNAPQPQDPEVASPCVSICTLDQATSSVCTGCGRHIGEIAEWSRAAPGRKRAIVDAARQRLAILRDTTSDDNQGNRP